ncbi:mandelate racemase/muconate lactonizing enzyme family protein [Paracoccus saliphilus]|uniref:L-alanine-DL-glutamate epimerase n=1 Tax=Paracoccus saliphilus TaxID=405559 RepID=A0AA45W2N8_9RHOB|nr:mandelate racemase/muconate lactonizing enzyme family protein [Paracoccus saliphilus]WCR01428.1 mandelate racemase/muconate lactonizing enzyme family protein [Paracoccus saliphilus]SIS69588.1 L-alanine-DL-glutamate epimerase [Paracoccus saliphilus]
MKIANIETIRLDIPFDDGGKGEGLTPGRWNNLEMLLVRIDTDAGLTGWGECFGYFCADAVEAFLHRSVIPLLKGADATDPAAISLELQRRLALFGRYGISIFALSGIDIALWDLRGKAEGKPLHILLGGAGQDGSVQAYASLVRYGDPDLAAKFTARAYAEGYRHIKLHEINRRDIAACNATRGDAELMVDVNCAWDQAEAIEMAHWLESLGTFWLEEPTFPPEDNGQLSRLKSAVPGLALSGGENLCTAWQFQLLIESGAIRYPQPSVTKLGGISEFLKVMKAAEDAGLGVMPHSPYFGPGYLATLQLCAVLGEGSLFEYLYVRPDAWLFDGMPVPDAGRIAVPDGPGLGFDPDPEVIARYRAA